MITSNTKQNQVNLEAPTLWVPDLMMALHHMPSFFQLAEYKGKVDHVAPGTHYILADPETPEATIKGLAWKIQQAGGTCYIHGINNSLENLVCDKAAGKELTIQIIEFARQHEDWIARTEQNPLTIREATAIAKMAIALLPESEKLVELSILRERCNLSPYEWSKLVKSLETRFQEELERRLGKKPAEKRATEKAERLKLEIQALLQEPDLIEKTIKRSEICSKFSISGKDLDLLISGLSVANNIAKAREYNAVEFRALEPEGISWIIPGLLPSSGVTVFAGPAGVGKSTLAYDAAAAILFGDEFLGETPTKKGKVVFVASDEPQPFVEDKFINRGIYGSDDYSIILDWDMSQISKLEESIEANRPTLVVIDSFSAIHKDPSFDENSAQARRSVEQLQALATRYNAAILLIHHTTKSKDQSGVGKVRGSTSIAAAGSATWLLDGEQNSQVRVFTTPKIRGAAPWNVRLTLDAPNGRWEIASGNEEENVHKTIGDRILEFMLTRPEARFEAEEIINAVGYGKQSVYKALDRLCQRGMLIKRPSQSDARRKVYRLVGSFSPPPSTTPLNVSNKISENLIQQGLGDSRQVLDNYSTDSGQPVEIVSSIIAETIGVPESEEIVDNSHSLGEGGSENLVEQQQDTEVIAPHTPSCNEENQPPQAIATDSYTPSKDDVEAIEGNAQLLRDAINLVDWETVKALTESWTEEFKEAVWRLLSPEDKKAVKLIASNKTMQ
ncbi:MAG: AAA family ATPase [Stigonema ocellatum SAG 48.90 = DSM 106950]|nr:AAA family ATPase [Stigonema ocellatum SAG 48.90 = DSM 106950]